MDKIDFVECLSRWPCEPGGKDDNRMMLPLNARMTQLQVRADSHEHFRNVRSC
jgi:hypothetical protein